ncbi:MAG: Lrp/AsnC ligand binding domain-containing protein [Paludibacteraceae bacterium]|nr:Lrp/AsnC ligand binding domain-containing protein [Paludibacteraceae bacterium]
MTFQLDELDRKILSMVLDNARIPFLEVARECGVSGAAIHQRIQKLMNVGVIKGSEFVIDTYKMGYKTCAFLGVVLNDLSFMAEVVKELKKIPEVVECHYATGKYAMFIKVYARDNRHLLHLILDRIAPIPGILTTEMFQTSLDEIFKRQLHVFDDDAWNEFPTDSK